MNPAALTAAHRTLPFGTKVKVTNQRNGKSVVVRINDRGPFARGRVLDLSKAAASQLGFIRSGHTKVCMASL
jgi:rare lipoprotein A